ncbi:alpha beta hydrolase fold domain-containing [Cyclospora cayetanensis]|uniref:Alpha beta hydrolase fold domain-containing n=1 Tax=Cyclospora cayetanensis TaxID=88456 RepID=A0A1D3CV05_9EIME|nr:alpha beta hydrolase fold domain-containing [Cyclospora cayetanensis]
MASKFIALGVSCLALAAAGVWRGLCFSDLSAVENMYSIVAQLMSRPQYLYNLSGIEHFRERSDLAMNDFLLRESQPVAFRASYSLHASYQSSAEEDGKEPWAVAPKASEDTLLYDEMYREHKLHAPTDPASVIIHRPHSFGKGVPAQLVPPHPLEPPKSNQQKNLTTVEQKKTIGISLYAPITCSAAPKLNKSSHPYFRYTLSSYIFAVAVVFLSLLLCSLLRIPLSEVCLRRLLVVLSTSNRAFFSCCSVLSHTQGNRKSGLRPVLFFLHGGGLVSLSSAAYDKLLRRMANLMGEADGLVISVDYRLAPEHKFPIPMEDCLFAISFVIQHAEAYGIDRKKIAMIGDSAGGALVASVLGEGLRLPQKYPWIHDVQHASLIYPSLCRGCPTRSHLLYGNKNSLSNDIWFGLAHTQTLGPALDWRQTPFSIPSKILSQFPPTSLVLFTHDIQYEIGILFHERLRRAGVSTSLFVAPGMHAFFGSDAWSSFGTKTVEWAIGRILDGFLRPHGKGESKGTQKEHSKRQQDETQKQTL